jgi:hypothetical protein
MNGAADLRLYRLDGDTISAGCFSCPLLADCGGYTRVGGGWSCMDQCASCSNSCDRVCMKRPGAFARDVLEVGGLSDRNVGRIEQGIATSELPHYIPVIQHGYAREELLPIPVAAIPLKEIMRSRSGDYAPAVRDRGSLRERFGLDPTTRVIILGTGKDRALEAYWHRRRANRVPTALAALDVDLAIAPNFSLFLDDPRTQHLFNRKRSLICAAEWSTCGISSVPYLHAITRADWDSWERFLGERPEISIIAKEFQTGLSNEERALETLDRIADLESRLGRTLHLIAVGAARFRAAIGSRLARWTILDSVPFMRAMKRRVAIRLRLAPRVSWRKALSEPVGSLLAHNILTWSDWIEDLSG